ncbi:hypothetical protein K2173_026452 [Erythroxylum novogranatense]|uniref:RING-type domain-containing protein n=1 Tax=Erythroxylum novogranatense TaxID=1862640 RepID=A0AAV8TYL2_9ROSI|nr:hypothetical protein K2173_026452 [Erythroxylum novogranatense]
MDYYELASGYSYQDSVKVLEADIQHANVLAASIPRAKGEFCVQMKLVYKPWAPIFFLLRQWSDCSCRCLLSRYLNLFHIVVYKIYSDGRPKISSWGRKATVGEFYGVILPSLQQLHGYFKELNVTHEEGHFMEVAIKKSLEDRLKLLDSDLEREDECGICLEACTKMVVPTCCHTMCVNCYRDWNTRNESCPFCRGSLRRVNSGDLWVLTCSTDVVDTKTVLKDDILRFYLYINSLPKDIPEALFLMYYEYLI